MVALAHSGSLSFSSTVCCVPCFPNHEGMATAGDKDSHGVLHAKVPETERKPAIVSKSLSSTVQMSVPGFHNFKHFTYYFCHFSSSSLPPHPPAYK